MSSERIDQMFVMTVVPFGMRFPDIDLQSDKVNGGISSTHLDTHHPSHMRAARLQ
jgi:hypothetical protein